MNDPIEATRLAQAESSITKDRPFVTLSYAQSLDASIAARSGYRYPISGTKSLAMTHQLRALHDSLLIGIGTALADDPQLNVRFGDGDDPDPVILDTNLRLPPDSRLLSFNRKVHIFCADQEQDWRAERLRDAGAQIHPTPQSEDGLVDMHAVLNKLDQLGYRSLMVEGGANVITKCLQHKVVDWVVLTIAPILLGGLRVPVLKVKGGALRPVRIKLQGTALYEHDQIIWGQPAWGLA